MPLRVPASGLSGGLGLLSSGFGLLSSGFGLLSSGFGFPIITVVNAGCVGLLSIAV